MSREVSDVIETVDATSWEGPFAGKTGLLVDALEDGKVIFFPHLNFTLSETEAKFLSPACADPTAKNVSFNAATGSLKHAVGDPTRGHVQSAVQPIRRRFVEIVVVLVVFCRRSARRLANGYWSAARCLV